MKGEGKRGREAKTAILTAPSILSKSVPKRWASTGVQVQTQSQSVKISVWLVGHPSGILWNHYTTEYLSWKEDSVGWDASLRTNLTSLHALAIYTDSSLGLGMYSSKVLRHILRPEFWNVKLLSSPLGRELFNFRFFMATSIYPGLGFSMLLFPHVQYHFWTASEKCSLPSSFASTPTSCLLLQTGICPKPFTTHLRVLTAPSVFSKLLMLLVWLWYFLRSLKLPCFISLFI